jgi:hypothetical protein
VESIEAKRTSAVERTGRRCFATEPQECVCRRVDRSVPIEDVAGAVADLITELETKVSAFPVVGDRYDALQQSRVEY